MAGRSEAEANPPTLPYWHVWTDDSGITHQTRCDLSGFELAPISEGVTPQWNNFLLTAAATVAYVLLPAGWVADWHENPKPQWIVPLSGRWYVETTDGVRVEMGTGDVALGCDQNSKPDAEGRLGHLSGVVGDEPCMLMLLQLNDDAYVAARPGIFK